MDEAERDAEDSIGSKPRSPGAPAARVHPWTGALHLMTQLFHTPRASEYPLASFTG